jgi:starch synthase
MRVLMISSEVESLARTGGLGDVVEALSLALAELGEDVLVVTPLYGVTRLPAKTMRWPGTIPVRHGWGEGDLRHASVVEVETVQFPSGGKRRICLLDDPGLYQRQGIYEDMWGPFGDNALRFAVMSRGALEIAARAWDGGPDIIHAHDWHATFAILYAKLVMGEVWARKPCVFTVHNLAFQGVIDDGTLDRLHLPREAYRPEVLWQDGHVNLMKGATALAERITTVSPTYAREILTPEGGFGLDGHLRAHASKVVGILNGIDTARFDPSADGAIAARYDTATFEGGRAACKDALAKEVGLVPDAGPIFGCVARLTWQKGIDLFIPLFRELIDRGARIVVVGQGERSLEDQLMWSAESFEGRVAVRIAFDPQLSRRVYAGAEFFVVPSRFEPCGLTQMYAMRYGSLPVVSDVGGLHDTVDGGPEGTGFVASRADVAPLRTACVDALELFTDKSGLVQRIRRAMGRAKDFAWSGPAKQYRDLFRDLLG